MHLCICYIQLKCRLDGLKYFILHLPARLFLGLVGEADPNTTKFTLLLEYILYLMDIRVTADVR